MGTQCKQQQQQQQAPIVLEAQLEQAPRVETVCVLLVSVLYARWQQLEKGGGSLTSAVLKRGMGSGQMLPLPFDLPHSQKYGKQHKCAEEMQGSDLIRVHLLEG